MCDGTFATGQSPVSTSSRPPSSAGRVCVWLLNKRVGCLPWSLNSPSAAQKSRRRRRSSESLCVSLLGLRPTARKLQSPNRNWFIFGFSSCAKQFSDQRSVPPAGLHCPQTVWWQAEGVLVAVGVHVAEGVHEAAGSPGADATRSWSVHVVVTQSELLKFFLFLFPSFSFYFFLFSCSFVCAITESLIGPQTRKLNLVLVPLVSKCHCETASSSRLATPGIFLFRANELQMSKVVLNDATGRWSEDGVTGWLAVQGLGRFKIGTNYLCVGGGKKMK